MGKFDGMLICTDLDGTLLKNDKTISCENIEAIEYFKREGGYFTFVTGRMPFFVSYVLDTIKPNVPFGCVNGAGLYDGRKGEYVWKAVMPKNVIELVKYIDNFNGMQYNIITPTKEEANPEFVKPTATWKWYLQKFIPWLLTVATVLLAFAAVKMMRKAHAGNTQDDW